MKNKLVKVAAAVPEIKVGDVYHNAGQMLIILEGTGECALVVFPELSLTGYTAADLFLSELLLEECQEALIKIADATKDKKTTVIAGTPIRYGNCLYNCGAVLSQGKIKALIPKSYLPNYSEFYECRWFESGRNLKGKSIRIGEDDVSFGIDILLEVTGSGAVLGVEICEDLWVPDKPGTHAALAGANIIANLSASDELIGKQEYRSQLVRQQSGSCLCAYIYASSGTYESSTDMVFSGHTIIAQNGSILKESIFPAYPHVQTALIDTGIIMHDRRRQNTFENTDIVNYRRIEVSIYNYYKENERYPSETEIKNNLHCFRDLIASTIRYMKYWKSTRYMSFRG